METSGALRSASGSVEDLQHRLLGERLRDRLLQDCPRFPLHAAELQLPLKRTQEVSEGIDRINSSHKFYLYQLQNTLKESSRFF